MQTQTSILEHSRLYGVYLPTPRKYRQKIEPISQMKGMLELEEKHIGMIHIICHANVPSKGILNSISG